MIRKINIIFLLMWYLLNANTTFAFTAADTLRGSNGHGRDWWDVQAYNLTVKFDLDKKSISGNNIIALKVIGAPGDSLQIDLQDPMIIDNIFCNGEKLGFNKQGNVWWVKTDFRSWKKNDIKQLAITYHGIPREAINPPWDGGISWKQDSTGKPWIAVSCQGLGASVWWPCKDAQCDEPDQGMYMRFDVPAELKCVSNGRMLSDKVLDDKTHAVSWYVTNPINNYDVSFYIGDYVHWQDTIMGEKGKLDLDFWVLSYNEARARKQFSIVKQMIHCFEYWMGPYPFYEDGYKLVDAPYLGMEHQSAVAYGNKYKMGYLGMDRTMTGIGQKFDYIIVHESGHEWFGNNITACDMADNWIHEGITTYSEALYVECMWGKETAQKYCRGEWYDISNSKPVNAPYGVNEEGPNDIYDKGSAIMYMVRTMTNDDEKFRQMLRGLGKEFYHQTVTTKQVEDYIASQTGLDLTAFFNQYLRTTDIPRLEYYIKDKELHYKFNNIVEGFSLPVMVKSDEVTSTINPTSEWQSKKWDGGYTVTFSKDFLMKMEK